MAPGKVATAAKKSQFLVVYTTFGNTGDAEETVRKLVERRLVACGTVVPGATSIFRWREDVQTESEVLAILKTERRCWSELEQAIGELHPYEVPELIAVPIELGSDSYLNWIAKQVS